MTTSSSPTRRQGRPSIPGMNLQDASEAYLVSLFEEISVRTPDSPSTSNISFKTLIETFAPAHLIDARPSIPGMVLQEAYLASLFEEISVRTPDSPSTSDISFKTLIETTLIETFTPAHQIDSRPSTPGMARQAASEAYLVSLFEEISVRTPDSPSTSDISSKTLIETFALAHQIDSTTLGTS
jgi:hypothetical protein